MLEAVKVALDPSPAQERAMLSHSGAARFAFNAGLAHVQEQIKVRTAAKEAGVEDELLPPVDWSFYSVRRWWNSAKGELAPWWAENSKEAYSSGMEQLGRALAAFSDSRSGKRKGPKMGFPQFKSRVRARKSWAYSTGAFGVAGPRAVKLPRIGTVHTHERIDTRIGDGRIMRVTVSQSGGRWFASFTVERETLVRPAPRGPAVGVDLGVKSLAVLSTGEVIANPKHLAAGQRRLTKASRAYARTQRGSAGRRKASDRLARQHARVGYLRADHLHKLTTRLARTHSSVVIEDLNVAGMVKNRSLARVISDAGFGEFRRQLEYKTAKFGSTLVVADRWFPSSKTCSACGTVKAKLSLSERTFGCEHCGRVIDRDLNAAYNLVGLASPVAGSGPETSNGSGGDQKPDHAQHARQVPKKLQPRTRKGSGVDRRKAILAS